MNKERTMGILMAVILSVAMGLTAQTLVLITNPQAANGQPVPVMYLSSVILSVIVGVIIALVVPLGRMGKNLAAKADANPPSMKFNLINSIPMAVGNTLIVGLILSGYGVFVGRSHASPEALAQMPPFVIMWIRSFAQLLLPTLIISYVLSIIIAPLLIKALGMAGGPPGGPRGPGGQEPR